MQVMTHCTSADAACLTDTSLSNAICSSSQRESVCRSSGQFMNMLVPISREKLGQTAVQSFACLAVQ